MTDQYKTMRIVLTYDEAKQHNLVGCECDHPESNHFEWEGRPCANCDCKRYVPIAWFGTLEDQPETPRADLPAGQRRSGVARRRRATRRTT